MEKKNSVRRSWLTIMFIVIFMSMQLLRAHSLTVYNYYTVGLYPIIKNMQGVISNMMSFSYGEIVVGTVLFLGIVLLTLRIRHLFNSSKYQTKSGLLKHVLFDIHGLVNVGLLMVILFQVLWGLNYYQPSLFTQLELEHQTITTDQLISTLEPIIEEVNTLRAGLDSSEMDLIVINRSIDQLLKQAYEDFSHCSEKFFFIKKPASHPKAIASSLLFSYNGISGIYNPFTGEANVNQLNSHFMIPVVALHELAHQQGVAREDEANFIAYIVSNESENDFSRYSGKMLLLIHGLNNLKERDSTSHKNLYITLSTDVKNDLSAHRELWAKYEGPLEETHEKMNDAYLKANGQSSGILSYSEMMELYVAWTLKNE